MGLECELSGHGGHDKTSGYRPSQIEREEEMTHPHFTVGDKVQVEVDLKEFQLKQADFGGWQPEMSQLISHIGSICESGVWTVVVQFDGSERKWILNPAVLRKVSKFSVGQIVRVKDDPETFKAMQLTLGNMSAFSLAAEMGCIVSKSQSNRNEEEFYLELVEQGIMKDAPMRPEWLEAAPVFTHNSEELSRLNSELVDILIKAAREGKEYIARQLVTSENVPVDSGRRVDGSTALHLACLNGHLSLIQWLIKKKADLEKEDLKGRRAVHYAVKGCQPEVLKLLIQRGAKLDPQTKKRKLSPLLKAVAKQFTDCVQILMDRNCNINIQDDDGDTALHVAAFSKTALFEALLQCDRVDLTLKNKKGFNIFHAAVNAGNVDVVQLLLDRQESLAFERVEGSQCSARHLASIKGDLQVVHLLLERLKERMVVDDVDREGQTALMKACREGHYGLIEFLVEMGADVNKVDSEGATPISLIIEDMSSHRPPLPDDSSEIHKIYDKFLKKYSETMTKFPSLSAVCFLIVNGAKVKIGNHRTDEDQKVTEFVTKFMKEVPTSMDDSDELQLVGNKMCMLCSSQAIPHVFNCCNTTSLLTCAKCYLRVKNCPFCWKSVESYQLNHQGQTQKEVTEGAANQHFVDHNYPKIIESSIAGLTIGGNNPEAGPSRLEYAGNADSSGISDVSPPKKRAKGRGRQRNGHSSCSNKDLTERKGRSGANTTPPTASGVIPASTSEPGLVKSLGKSTIARLKETGESFIQGFTYTAAAAPEEIASQLSLEFPSDDDDEYDAHSSQEMSSSKNMKPSAGHLKSNLRKRLRSNTQEEEMSEEPNPTGGTFLHSTEDVKFAGKNDPMTIVGCPSSGVSIPTEIKREKSDDEENLPLLNLNIRDERGKISIWTPEEQQLHDYSVLQRPAEEPEHVIDQVPGADDIIKIEEAEPDYSISLHDNSWKIQFLTDEPKETEGCD